jgi:adenosyl cobinamide kinase/adenosyl cobinamide phosphate guanylyltransferase
MIQIAFQDKTEFFVLDDLEARALYTAARNVEIAVWKLSNARNVQEKLFLMSNEGVGLAPNFSFEREFGKIIGSLDMLAKIVADKSNRTVVKIIQNLATAVFLPIKF